MSDRINKTRTCIKYFAPLLTRSFAVPCVAHPSVCCPLYCSPVRVLSSVLLTRPYIVPCFAHPSVCCPCVAHPSVCCPKCCSPVRALSRVAHPSVCCPLAVLLTRPSVTPFREMTVGIGAFVWLTLTAILATAVAGEGGRRNEGFLRDRGGCQRKGKESGG